VLSCFFRRVDRFAHIPTGPQALYQAAVSIPRITFCLSKESTRDMLVTRDSDTCHSIIWKDTMQNKGARPSPPTQTDVARLAGVSRTTVSYVLSNNTSVSIPEETRERIWKAAAKLNYTPHTQAQRLRSGKTGTITMLYPWDDVSTQIELEFLTGAARAATEEEHFLNLITAPMSEQSLLNL
jgi:transcriptional regulator with XRE-family HTH domain